MDLIKENWSKKDGEEFIKYLESLKNPDKVEWSKNILNTQMDVLAIKTKEIKDIVKEIYKGDFISFLDLNLNKYFENTSINGSLITKIKDFELMKKYLDNYISTIDNWASCDLLSFETQGREKEYFNLTLEYVKNKKPFIRRVGLIILFRLVDKEEYIYKIFNILNGFYKEEHYYVNMVNAWLLCECFIKQREKTIEFLKTHKLNKFTINKAISKCRDSFRVSQEDKDMLISYRIK